MQKLATQKTKPRAVIQELRVHNGNAIADVVTLHTEAHCYEIKGCTDKVERVVVQGRYYNRTFRRITLVTTERNLRRAVRFAPSFWGILVARSDGTTVRFRHVRRARLNPEFDRQAAAMMLWRNEMLELVPDQQFRRKPRDFLAQLIAETKRNLELSSGICELLLGRYQGLRSALPAPCR